MKLGFKELYTPSAQGTLLVNELNQTVFCMSGPQNYRFFYMSTYRHYGTYDTTILYSLYRNKKKLKTTYVLISESLSSKKTNFVLTMLNPYNKLSIWVNFIKVLFSLRSETWNDYLPPRVYMSTKLLTLFLKKNKNKKQAVDFFMRFCWPSEKPVWTCKCSFCPSKGKQ